MTHERLHRVMNNGQHYSWLFYCPGCEIPHQFDTRWEFNENIAQPTFTPSLLCKAPIWDDKTKSMRERVCHLYLTDGKIHFLGDCSHRLVGQIVELPEFQW